MKIILAILLLCFFISESYGQAQIVLNNNVFVVMNGGSQFTPIYVVLDNPNANGLTTAGSGGNWISEDEFNKLRWRIGNAVGTYQIPYTALTLAPIPFEMQITGAGVGGDYIDFSTYGTPTNNLPWPTMVTHFNAADGSTTDNSPNTINRFWVNDSEDYTTRPNVTMSFGYDDPGDFVGLNPGIVPGAMRAQRFRTSDDTWGGSYSGSSLFFGVDNGSAVVNAVVTQQDMWQAWTLTTTAVLLPVELIAFQTKCLDSYAEISWTTASEVNNDYFQVERSINGENWEVIGIVQGNGTTSNENHYSLKDENPRGSIAYYRLRQVDFDGTQEVFPIKSLQPCADNSGVEIISHNNGNYQVIFNADLSGDYQIDLYDMSGKKIRNTKTVYVDGGENLFLFDDSHAATGVYMVRVSNNQEQITKRIVIHK
jgi:hypothetical protein